MARGTRLIIELGPAWISGAVIRGGQTGPVVTEPLDPEAWEQHWTDRLRPLDAPLARLVKALDATGAPTTLYHCGPEVQVDLFSCPGTPRDARAAALLSLSEQATFEIENNPHGAWPLLTDEGTPPRQTHVLIACDKAEAATLAAEWLDRAGLRVEALIPADGPHLSRLVTRLIEHPDASPRVVMWIGSHHSAVAVGAGGKLGLVRRLDMGVETLVSAALKPVAELKDLSDTITMPSRDEARSLLTRIGIPAPDTVIDTARGIRGAKILPLLQPILQRWVVELKQSLRFGLPEKDRAGAKLTIIGPGALVPRLAEVLATQTDLTLEADPSPASEQTDIHAAASWTPVGLNLLPGPLARASGARRVRTALLAGAAAAALVAVVTATLSISSTRAVRQRLAELTPTLTSLNQMVAERDAVQSQAAALERTLRSADRVLGFTPRWDALLGELALLTPAEVRLTDIECNVDSAAGAAPAAAGRPSASSINLHGMVIARAGDDHTATRARLVEYVEALTASPLFESVTLGATERTTGDGTDAVSFKITARAIEHLGNPARADASEGVTP